MCGVRIAALALLALAFWAPSNQARALDGALYTIATPIPNPRDPIPIAYGFIRLINGGTTEGTIDIKIVGLQTGNVYGSGSFPIAAHAAPQLPTSFILDKAGITGGPIGADLGFAYWMKASQPRLGYAAVNYNPLNSAFENVSNCSTSAPVDAAWTDSMVPNVHMTTISQFPSFINLYNTYDHAVTYQYDVYDAFGGAFLGTTSETVPTNTVFVLNSTALQSRIGFTPTAASLGHMTVFITPVTAASERVNVNHYVFFVGQPGTAGHAGVAPTLVGMGNFCPITQ